MTLYDSLILGLVQGLTEFLPISSSGHLVLMHHYLGMNFGPSTLQHFDIVMHAGSLIAILLYFRATWWHVLSHPFRRERDGSPPLLPLLFAASIPVAIAGYVSADWIEIHTRTPLFVAFGFIATGGLLIAASWYEGRFAGKESVGWEQALGVGIGQALAVLPGFSRSGITISSGRFMGLTAVRATEFAFLLGAPALFGALLFTLQSGTQDLQLIGTTPLLIGFGASLISSFACIHFLLTTIRKYGVWMFSAYLFVAAALIIADEMMPIVQSLPQIGQQFELRVLVGTLFIALLLEAVPFTSAFVPGFSAMVAIGILLRGDPLRLAACMIIGAAGIVIGNLIGYIPARQARLKVHWKEKADHRLMKTQLFFQKWGRLAVFFGGWWAPFRPLISIAAGLGNMRPLPYITTMILGSLTWAIVVMGGSAFIFSVLQ